MDFDDLALKKYVIDFVEGHVEARDFMLRFQNDPQLSAWLQSIVPKGKVSYVVVFDESRWSGYGNATMPYDIHHEIDEYAESPERIGNQLNVHHQISQLIMEAFPDDGIKKSDKFEKRFRFLIRNCPNSVGGPEANAYIEKILNEIPEDLPNKTRAQMFRARIKEEFHLDGKRYPYWLQEAEWPFNNGKPMRYASQASKGEMRFYLFEDVETGEERVVIQSY